MTSQPEWIVVARLIRPQGRNGEVLAELLTGFPERLQGRRQLFLARPQFDGDPDSVSPIEVASFWLPKGKNEGRVVLQVAGVTSIEDAERLAGLEVITPRQERLPLRDNESYISDLIGCEVFDRGIAVGTLQDVQFPTTPDGRRRLTGAAPLLVVTPPSGEDLLLPYVRDFLVSVSLEQKRIDMTLPDGLIDLNAGSAPDRADELQKRNPRPSETTG